MARNLITASLIGLASIGLGCRGSHAAHEAAAAGTTSPEAGAGARSTVGAAAAGQGEPTHEIDPGAPSVKTGPKAVARLSVEHTRVGDGFFTALAPKQGQRAHLFAQPWSTGQMGVSSFYVSLVMDNVPWHAGSYAGALGGKASFVLSDGRRYSGDASELDVKATIEVVGDSDPQAYYLRGALDLTVPAEEPGAPPLDVHIQINDSQL
jgi:hypothetical protein